MLLFFFLNIREKSPKLFSYVARNCHTDLAQVGFYTILLFKDTRGQHCWKKKSTESRRFYSCLAEMRFKSIPNRACIPGEKRLLGGFLCALQCTCLWERTCRQTWLNLATQDRVQLPWLFQEALAPVVLNGDCTVKHKNYTMGPLLELFYIRTFKCEAPASTV